MAGELPNKTIDQLDNKVPSNGNDLILFREAGVTGTEREKNCTRDQLMSEGAVADNTAYKDRVKTKVLWTGPLSIEGVPTSLDAGERFGEWDSVVVLIRVDNNTINNSGEPWFLPLGMGILTIRSISQVSGIMTFEKLSDTTFQITSKTMAAGNISRIIGVNL